MRSNGVSVIMPTYNAEHFVAAAIESVLAQTWNSFELIIIDDSSKDGTRNIVERYMEKDRRIKYYCNQKNSGVAFSRDRGISLASFDWIAFLDSDDLWKPDKLEKQIKSFESDPNLKLCYTGSCYFCDDSRKNVFIEVPETITLSQLLRKNVIPCSSVMLKKDCLESKKMNHDDAHEDYLLWLQLLREGNKAKGINEPLLMYRFRSDSKSGNKRKSAIMTYRTYRYFGLNFFAALKYMFFYAIESITKYQKVYRNT